MTAYYNEHDPFAAAWLRELITDNLIAPGEVDERSIEDVTPNDLRPFQQCHFFAGIGVWSLAARRAGIPDDAPLWTGSCPCQPFSAAGKGGGFADERHLWPSFHYLIEQCGPEIIAGEQVAGADGDAWFDLVSADLDATGYAFGVAETCAAGFGAPHKRQRNYWVARRLAERERERLEGYAGHGNHWRQPGWVGADAAGPVAARSDVGGLADDLDDGQRQHGSGVGGAAAAGEGRPEQRQRFRIDPADDGAVGGLEYADDDGRQPGGLSVRQGRPGEDAAVQQRPRQIVRPGPVNGLWRDADWLLCRDEPVPKWRPVEPGSFPLVDAGTFRNRVGLLRGAGNAVTLGQAEGFLRAVIASIG